ncbi:MAG: SDR family oxidoreductase [Phycisphaerales bacterium]|nr:SDR family oxidoreductase [Phycisphaerales bacterium]
MSSTYLITGANRGIGLEFAGQLAAKGISVIAGVRNPESAETLHGLNIPVETLDVANTVSVTAFAERLEGRPVDVLINNAGISATHADDPREGRPLEQLKLDEMPRLFDVNSIGPVRVTQALLPNLRAGRRKVVVNISSNLGSITDNTEAGWYAYRASKAALNMLNRSMAIELGAEGFTCVVIHPGWVRTDMGGPEAPLSTKESVTGMLNVIDQLTTKDNGCFLDYHGQTMPW